jgi:alpha,alpha-trehalase
MFETAKGMIENFIHLVKEYGFVPNGGRIYYLNRSQPPLLTLMVQKYYEFTHDLKFVEENLEILEKEYQFWRNHRSNSIDGQSITLNNYNAANSAPRPESYIEDLEDAVIFQTDTEKQKFYKDIASAAESGWDFSSRWFDNHHDRTTAQTSDILPVDLNSILYKVETLLQGFYTLTNQTAKAQEYESFATQRKQDIKALLYNEEECWWNDFNLKTKSRNPTNYLSNVFPLWAGATDDFTEEQVECFLNTTSKFMHFEGGSPASFVHSEEQWDFPNVWAPLEYIFVEALNNLKSSKASKTAEKIAKKWLLNNYCTWAQTGHMYEKYNAKNVGQPGHGGEYEVQTGFGWTNGIALYLLQEYGHTLSSEECPVKFTTDVVTENISV